MNTGRFVFNPSRRARRSSVLLLAALLFAHPALGQKGRGATAGRPRTPEAKRQAKGRGESNARAARERRLAVAAVMEAIEAARSSEEAFEKVRLQAEAADLLWPHDEQSARAVLRSAWDATTAPDALDDFKSRAESGPGAREMILHARRAVVTSAARHDARLADSYAGEVDSGLPPEFAGEEDEATDGGASPSRRATGRDVSARGQSRLLTAQLLLQEGAYRSAAVIAAPVATEGVSRPLFDFIMRLREFAPREADALYLRLLEVTRADPAADANDVLLLSAPVVSPGLLAFVSADGGTNLAAGFLPEAGARRETDAMPPALRRAFFDTAAAVLLRPSPARAASEPLAPFFAIGRLLPFFDREAPRHSPALRARMAALSQELEEARRARASEQMQVLSLKPKNKPDPLKHALEKLSRARGDEERDALRFEAVEQATARKLWERARRLAAEMGNAEPRSSALRLIESRQVLSVFEGFEDEANGFERAAAFVRAADVHPAVRASGYAQAAELAARKGKRARSSELFAEALAVAADVPKGSEVRVRVLALLASAATRVEPSRAWELLGELASAVNEIEDAPRSDDGGEGCDGFALAAPGGLKCYSLADDSPEPEEVFTAAARLDLGRALEAARGVKEALTRAALLLAAARGVLGAGARRTPEARTGFAAGREMSDNRD